MQDNTKNTEQESKPLFSPRALMAIIKKANPYYKNIYRDRRTKKVSSAWSICVPTKKA